jgi:hypothetical protein
MESLMGAAQFGEMKHGITYLSITSLLLRLKIANLLGFRQCSTCHSFALAKIPLTVGMAVFAQSQPYFCVYGYWTQGF